MFKLFASCDSGYLNVHAPALVASAAKAGNNFHLHVINATPNDVSFVYYLKHKWEFLTDAEFSCSWKDQYTKSNSPEELRTIYACDRFVTMGDRLRFSSDSYLVIDTDCLIMEKIEEPDADVGLFLRQPIPGTQGWENLGTRVAAGAVYYSLVAVDFAEEVASRIRRGPPVWFLDQVAIDEVYQNNLSNYRYSYFDGQFMDWQFLPDTNIWTGKGPRKYDNQTYLAKKNEFDRMIR